MKKRQPSRSEAFNQDMIDNLGYRYTTNAPLSSYLANKRNTRATLEAVNLRDKKVLDIGCGDGVYTVELYDKGKPTLIWGIDQAKEAIKQARKKVGKRQVFFKTESAYQLSFFRNFFDLVIFRGVLHHLDKPSLAIKEAFRVGKRVIVIEPNGLNLGLKLLESFSRYHLKHQERSYFPSRLKKWLKGNGQKVVEEKWFGLVPFFCPDWLARMLKKIEPWVEKAPFLRVLCCAVYLVVTVKNDS